jgi:hypothetical protein
MTSFVTCKKVALFFRISIPSLSHATYGRLLICF